MSERKISSSRSQPCADAQERSHETAASMETMTPMFAAIGGRPAIAHLSDCALHNPPAEPRGLCNCGAARGKHTPGPWSFEPENAEDDGSIYPARIVGGQRQLVVCYLTDLTRDAMWESGDDCRSKSANAHLMIAAPEMFEALVALKEDTLSAWWDLPREHRDRIEAALQIARPLGSGREATEDGQLRDEPNA